MSVSLFPVGDDRGAVAPNDVNAARDHLHFIRFEFADFNVFDLIDHYRDS